MTCINADRELIDVIDEDYVKLQEISKDIRKKNSINYKYIKRSR
jgi:hypothetical protein